MCSVKELKKTFGDFVKVIESSSKEQLTEILKPEKARKADIRIAKTAEAKK